MAKPALIETYAQLPFTIASGSGSRVRDTRGREYWDFYGGHAVALLGHAHPVVTKAIREQAETLTFYSNVAPLEIRTRAAERLTAFAPTGLEHVFFCNSGAEANENALKLAIQQTRRNHIAALSGGFHGRTLLALSATSGEKLRQPFEGLLCPSRILRPNVIADVSSIDETVAAVIVEPIQSMAGVVELRSDFLRALRERCDAVGALLIYDEVQTGMGRLGRPFAAGEFGVTPDMLTLAKGIANGIPIGAVLMSPRIAERVGFSDLGSTFGGGPVACAALLAVLETVESERLCEQATAIGERLREKLQGCVTEVLGRGCLIGLRLAVDAKGVQQRLLEAGFITATSGDPHVLRLLPPINMPLEAVDEFAATFMEIAEESDEALAESARR